MKTSLLEKLREVGRQAEPVPKGWKTSVQLQAEWGFSQSQVSILLIRGMKSGIVEMKKFRIAGLNGMVKCVPHYREKSRKSSGSS